MEIPELKYWFTPDAIWPVGSFALAIWFGFVPLKNMISKWHFRAVAAAFALLAVFGWWSIAKQTSDTARANARYDGMARTLGTISQAVGVTKITPSVPMKDAILSKIGEYQQEIKQYEEAQRAISSNISSRLSTTEQEVKEQLPRTISAKQREILIKNLSVPEGQKLNVLFITQSTCLDCTNFAAILIEVFRKAGGWGAANMSLYGGGLPMPGVTLVFPDDQKSSKSGAYIIKAFKRAGIPLRVITDSYGYKAFNNVNQQAFSAPDGVENAAMVELRIEPKPYDRP